MKTDPNRIGGKPSKSAQKYQVKTPSVVHPNRKFHGSAALDSLCAGMTPSECMDLALQLKFDSDLVLHAAIRAGHASEVVSVRIGLPLSQITLLAQAAPVLGMKSAVAAAELLLSVALSHLEIIERLAQGDQTARGATYDEMPSMAALWADKAAAAVGHYN
jgi:hypothetical protein